MLVGRESERQVLTTLLAGARVGDSRVLVLRGDPGIGKTALLAEAETLVGDMRVLRARGVESEQLVPFAGLLQLLRPVLPLLDTIPPPQSAALGSALMLSPSPAAEPSRFAVGAATLSLLSRAAEDRPLAVLVDDAHLLDRSSAEALVFAARRLLSDPVAVLVALRADAAGSSSWSSLPTLTVTGLGLEETGALLARTSGAVRREQVIRLHRATAGNPLALLELGERLDRIESLPAAAPLTVSEQLVHSFIGRVAHLGEDTRTAVLVAAADSTSVATVRQACRVLGLTRPRLDEAEDAGLLAVRGDRVEFRHPLVRAAVYGGASAESRRAVHRALAAVIAADQTDRLAWHLAEGAVPPDEETAATLDRVGRQATARGAHAIAASAHERAAELTGTATLLPGRLAAAGDAAWLSGRTDRAVELLDRALLNDPEPMLRMHIQALRGAVETRCGSLEAALATLLTAADDARSSDPDTAVRLLADAVHVAFYLLDPVAAMRASDDIDSLLGRCVDANARSLGSMASGMALVLSGSGAQGIERVRAAAYPLLIQQADPADRFRLPVRLLGALWLRDAGPFRAQVGEAIDELRDQAALGSLPYVLMHIARDAATSNRWDDAEGSYQEAIRLAGETGQTTDLAVSLAGLACLDARRGHEQECRAGVAAAEDLCRRNHIRIGSIWLEFAQGDLASGLGDPETAARHYEALETQLTATGLADPDQSCGAELVEAYVQLGRGTDARRAADLLAAKAEAKGQPWSLARARRALGLCGSVEPSGGSARETSAGAVEGCFREALELHAETPDTYETARTELAFGANLRRARRRVAARPFLKSALDTFEALGARPWADRAAQELEATGETVRRREADMRDQLTPQERQIAQLLAAGRTTREAAAALFISPKTVEYHLRHVYLKLDIRSRSALAHTFGPG